jgi:hypothetical protein
MNIYPQPSNYPQNHPHEGCPVELPSHPHGHICMAVKVRVTGEAVEVGTGDR